jgi:hypothetical protein
MSTKVERSGLLTLAMFGAAILLANLSMTIYEDYAGFGKSSGFFGWIGFFLTALLSILGVLGAIFIAGRSPCPHCKDTLSLIDLYSDIECAMCPSCKQFYQTKKGEILAIPAGSVADKPTYPYFLPEGNLEWPKKCAVCSQKSTRSIEVTTATDKPEELPLSLRVALFFGLDGDRVKQEPLRFKVPHCDKHDDGVEVEGGGYPRAKFRSLAYRQQFIELQEKK